MIIIIMSSRVLVAPVSSKFSRSMKDTSYDVTSPISHWKLKLTFISLHSKERTPCEETEREFRIKRNAVKASQHRACSQYFLSSYRHSRSTTWKDIRRFLVSSSKPQPISHSPADHQPGWQDRLNRYFADVGSTVAEELAAATPERRSGHARHESSAAPSAPGRRLSRSCPRHYSAWARPKLAEMTASPSSCCGWPSLWSARTSFTSSTAASPAPSCHRHGELLPLSPHTRVAIATTPATTDLYQCCLWSQNSVNVSCAPSWWTI